MYGFATSYGPHVRNERGRFFRSYWNRFDPQSESEYGFFDRAPMTWEQSGSQIRQMLDDLSAAGFESVRIFTDWLQQAAMFWRGRGSSDEAFARVAMDSAKEKMREVCLYAIGRGLKLEFALSLWHNYGELDDFPPQYWFDVYFEEFVDFLDGEIRAATVGIDFNEQPDWYWFRDAPGRIDVRDGSVEWLKKERPHRIENAIILLNHVWGRLIDLGIREDLIAVGAARPATQAFVQKWFPGSRCIIHGYHDLADLKASAEWLGRPLWVGEFGVGMLRHLNRIRESGMTYGAYQASVLLPAIDWALGNPQVLGFSVWDTMTRGFGWAGEDYGLFEGAIFADGRALATPRETVALLKQRMK